MKQIKKQQLFAVSHQRLIRCEKKLSVNCDEIWVSKTVSLSGIYLHTDSCLAFALEFPFLQTTPFAHIACAENCIPDTENGKIR